MFLNPARAPRQSQRGLSLVELMVGMVVGLLVVAGASLVASTQLADTRRLLLDTQIQQDLRAAADIITRELRRAGSYGIDDLAQTIVWNPLTPTVNAVVNPFVTVTVAGSQVDYGYYRTASATGPFGFKLESGVIKSLIDSGTVWQDLTDVRAVKVTAFTIAENTGVPAFQIPCPNDCPTGGQACWPTIKVRELTLTISAEAVADKSVTRTLSTVVRLRNDRLNFSGTTVCPP
jgi:prepilin-type N-terminal cleavage/methylation domain-containing protein